MIHPQSNLGLVGLATRLSLIGWKASIQFIDSIRINSLEHLDDRRSGGFDED